MITKEQAFLIAKQLVPDIEERRSYHILDQMPRKNLFVTEGEDPEYDNQWCVSYSKDRKDSDLWRLISSDGVVISRTDGRIIYHGDLGDEG